MIFAWLKSRKAYARLKSWIDRHERSLVSVFLVGGFLLHYVTFKSIEVGMTLIGLGIYLALAAACIVYVPFHEKHGTDWSHPLLARLLLAVPFLLQVAFGSLLSMALLFYWFSGSVSVSWPVFAILVVLIIFNEGFRHAYLRPGVQVALFAFVLFAYTSVLFPYLFHSLEPWVVLLGGMLSLILSLLLVILLLYIAPTLRARWWRMVASVVLVSGALNLLFLADLIPPIPLSLREAGVYHDVQRIGDEYILTGETETWWQRLIPGQLIQLEAGGRLYVFTSIYTPTNLDTVIYHEWEFYNEDREAWESQSRLSFPITGGRVDGYRGYTFKTRLQSGEWRVSVETARGQTLGRVYFTLIASHL